MTDVVIYCDITLKNFLSQLLLNKQKVFKKLDDFKNSTFEEKKPSIVFINNSNKNNLAEIEKKHQNILYIITQDTKTLNDINIKKVKAPLKLQNLKNIIDRFLSNISVLYKDISVSDKIVSNINNNTSCNLTDIEKEILLHLIQFKTCSKKEVKKNILKINSKVETSSLESHLTRIRKKLEKIKSKIIIQSKNDELMFR